MSKIENFKAKLNNSYIKISMRVLLVAGIVFMLFNQYIFNEARYFLQNLQLRPIDNLLAEFALPLKMLFDTQIVKLLLIIFSLIVITVFTIKLCLFVKTESSLVVGNKKNKPFKKVNLLEFIKIYKLHSKFLC